MSLISPIATSLFLPITAQTIPQFSEVEFPLTNELGFKESWKWEGIKHQKLNYSIATKHHGYRVSWEFKFSDWADGSTYIKFKTIKNALDAGFRWNLRPRNLPQFYSRIFEIYCESDNFDIVTDSGELWHTELMIKFSTVELVPSIDWMIYTPDSAVEYAVEIDSVAFQS